jgi:lipopolysaccharide export system protein LptA
MIHPEPYRTGTRTGNKATIPMQIFPRSLQVLLPLLAALASTAAQAALVLDRNAPIQIEADSATIDEPSGTAVYRGKVVLQQGTLKLQSRELTVVIKDGRALQAVAAGVPVLLDQSASETDEAIHAEARKITFLIKEDRMLLDNQATLRQGERLFQGAHIDYDVVNRRVNASGGGSSRVLLVLPPTPAEEKKPGAARPQSTLLPAGKP